MPKPNPTAKSLDIFPTRRLIFLDPNGVFCFIFQEKQKTKHLTLLIYFSIYFIFISATKRKETKPQTQGSLCSVEFLVCCLINNGWSRVPCWRWVFNLLKMFVLTGPFKNTIIQMPYIMLAQLFLSVYKQYVPSQTIFHSFLSLKHHYEICDITLMFLAGLCDIWATWGGGGGKTSLSHMGTHFLCMHKSLKCGTSKEMESIASQAYCFWMNILMILCSFRISAQDE